MKVNVLQDEWVRVFVPVDGDSYPEAEELDVEDELWGRYVAALNAFKAVREELNAAVE